MEFIADPGTAWCGSLDVFYDIVQAVKKSGGTAIKPQVWPKNLYKGHEMEKEALRAWISKGTLRRMIKLCKDADLEMFCSVFGKRELKTYINAYWEVMGITPSRVKISCGMNDNWPLIEAVLSQENFERIYVSVESDEDLDRLLSAIRSRGFEFKYQGPFVPLYCVPKYPTMPEDVHFPHNTLIKGFSDHTLGIAASITAAALGLEVIERHVMLSEEQYLMRLGYEPRFPDEVCAATMPKFRTIVRTCNEARRMAGHD